MKKKAPKPFAIKIYFLFLLVFFVVVSFVLFNQYEMYKKYELLEQTQLAELDEEYRKKLDLQAELDNINSDSFIEKKAREELGYIKSNELIFRDKNN